MRGTKNLGFALFYLALENCSVVNGLSDRGLSGASRDWSWHGCRTNSKLAVS